MNINLHDLPAYVLTNDLTPDYEHKGQVAFERAKELGYNVVKYKGVSDYDKGCDKSHYKLHSDTHVKTPYILFEDDILPMSEEYVFDIPDDADALFLGTSRWSRAWDYWMYDSVIYSNVSEKIVKVNNMLCSHAIVVITESYRDILKRCLRYSFQSKDRTIGFDQYVVDLMKIFNVYSVNNPLFCQEGRYLNATNISVRDCGMTIEDSQSYYERHLRPYHSRSMDSIHTHTNTHNWTKFEPLNYN